MTNFEIAKRVARESRHKFEIQIFCALIVLAVKYGAPSAFENSRYAAAAEIYMYFAIPVIFVQEFIKLKKSLKNK